jgi:hypothetical protein
MLLPMGWESLLDSLISGPLLLTNPVKDNEEALGHPFRRLYLNGSFLARQDWLSPYIVT